jgi:nitrite transporter NirC
LDEQVETAQGKASSLFRTPGRYLVLAALAGAFIGVAVVLLLMVTGPLSAAESPWTKLIQGMVFGVALTLVIFSGAELCTSNMMTMVQGLGRGPKSVRNAVAVILISFVGNLVGAIVFAWLVHSAGVLDIAAPGKPAPGATLLATMVKAKMGESPEAMFFRGVLCNFLVCVTVWMGVRTRSDGAKLALIFWGLLAFVGSGFDHVVANMTTFSLALFEHVPGVTVGAFAHNLLFVGLGNLVGGGLLVGASYAFVSRRTPATVELPKQADAEPELAAESPAAVPAGKSA